MASFPQTTWGLVSRLAKTAQRPLALADLCQRYWRPAYSYVRSAWAKNDADAQDLTQAFFLWLLEGDALARYEPERGGFRPYLRTLLRRFVGHQETALHRLKRGGGTRLIEIDAQDIDLPTSDATPEQSFDRAWVSEIVNQAIARVADQWRSTGRGIAFDAYERYELDARAERPTYTQLAEQLGLSVQQVKNHLFRVREAVRREIRSELREMTSDDDELEEEWRVLFG